MEMGKYTKHIHLQRGCFHKASLFKRRVICKEKECNRYELFNGGMLRNTEAGVPWRPAVRGPTQTNRLWLQEIKSEAEMQDSDKEIYTGGTQIQG